MKKNLIFLALFALLSGCGEKKQIVHEPLKNEALAYTSKAEIIDGQDRTLIIATYLNPLSKSKVGENVEKFIIAINPKEKTITKAQLNGDDNVSIREIQPDDEMLELVSFELPWARYYEISAPQVVADKLKLTCEIYPSSLVVLNFVKVSKSLYWNP